jgi:hypothetical protein
MVPEPSHFAIGAGNGRASPFPKKKAMKAPTISMVT